MSVPSIQDCKLCFIGGGNMGAAIVAGLLANGSSSPDNITVSDPSDATRHKAQTTLGVRTTASNLEAARGAHVLVLAVKPQVARAVCVDLAAAWAEDDDHQQQEQQGRPWPLVVSIVGGVTLTSLTGWLTLGDGRVPKVVRVMPNTPALLGEGASGAFAGEGVSADEKGLVADLLNGFSKVTEWVEREELIDVVTGVSGSGPAYFFAMVEHMISSATAMGLPSDQAERLAKQTCLGAGRMLAESASDSPAQLRKNVTSPNGATQAALKSFDESGFQEIVNKAVRAAVVRAEELGNDSG